MAEKVDDYEFSPGHPSYYKQGKPALKPEDIPAMDTSKDDVPSPFYIGGNPIRIPKNPGDKRTERLLEAKKAYEEELDKDVKKYKKYVKLYETGADEIKSPEHLSLKHNHICYQKGWIERIERELGIITSNKQLTLNI
tara:strand:+ start:607 stop:1020 length:414 start_codon:yes stop_codon:yes gene_type:complete